MLPISLTEAPVATLRLGKYEALLAAKLLVYGFDRADIEGEDLDAIRDLADKFREFLVTYKVVQ